MDFHAKDLHLPDPERTRFILSAFIKFVKFAEQCPLFVSGLCDKLATIIEKRERVTQELGGLLTAPRSTLQCKVHFVHRMPSHRDLVTLHMC